MRRFSIREEVKNIQNSVPFLKNPEHADISWEKVEMAAAELLRCGEKWERTKQHKLWLTRRDNNGKADDADQAEKTDYLQVKICLICVLRCFCSCVWRVKQNRPASVNLTGRHLDTTNDSAEWIGQAFKTL